MKKILFSFVLLLPVSLYAQSFWGFVHDHQFSNKSHITDKALFQDTLILISGFVSDASCPSHVLCAYKLTGENTWSNGGTHDLITVDPNFIYTAGYIPIDNVIGYEQVRISKYDRNGVLQFSIGYPDTPHVFYYEFTPKSLSVANDGTILVSSDNKIIKSDTSGSYINEYGVNTGTPIREAIAVNSFLYLVNTGNKIIRSDSSFNLLDSVQFAGTINRLMVINDTVYTLFDSGLIRMDTSLVIIDTLLSGIPGTSDMELYSGDLWVQQTETDSVKLLRINESGIQESRSFPLLLNNPGGIVANSNYYFTGNSFSGQMGMYYFENDSAALLNYSLPDVELLDFTISNITIDYYYFQGDSIPTGYYFSTEATIKNNGNDTLSTFSLFADLEGGMNCAQNYLYRKFSGYAIPPGQTQTVNLNQQFQSGINNNVLCFECLAPNSMPETSIANNVLCKTFNITGIKNIPGPAFRVYPNPVNDYIIIESLNDAPGNIELIDITGKPILRKPAFENNTKIDVSNLSRGPYILKIQSENAHFVRLIIVE